MSIIESMIFKDNTILVYKNDNSKIAEKEEDGQEFVPLRSMIPLLSPEDLHSVLKEFQFQVWDNKTKFCGACGAGSVLDNDEVCKVCPECNEKYFPYLFPAVIVAITKGDEILLAHNTNFPGDMHSVIAGFVDLGENLEDCVRREIQEEVGLEVEDIEYFGSQNWGFSSSLMIAFKAKYKSGDIKIDGKEIDKACWFTKDNLPEIPPNRSMGRLLIDDFANNN